MTLRLRAIERAVKKHAKYFLRERSPDVKKMILYRFSDTDSLKYLNKI